MHGPVEVSPVWNCVVVLPTTMSCVVIGTRINGVVTAPTVAAIPLVCAGNGDVRPPVVIPQDHFRRYRVGASGVRRWRGEIAVDLRRWD